MKDAPYNPRTLSERAREKLKANIKNVGILNPPVWNCRTGNIVSGHQRVHLMDSLYRTKDYYVTVAKVDLDEKTEKEQNIFFNNQEAQGDWSMEKLEKMFLEDKISYEGAGFDMAQIKEWFGDTTVEEALLDESVRKKLEDLKDSISKITGVDADEVNLTNLGSVKADYKNKRALENINAPNYYLIFVFPSINEREQLTEAMGWRNSEWQNGVELIDKLIAKEKEEEDE